MAVGVGFGVVVGVVWNCGQSFVFMPQPSCADAVEVAVNSSISMIGIIFVFMFVYCLFGCFVYK